MVIEILLCRHCQSQNVIKHGRDKRGVQRFRCHDCRHTFHKSEDDRSYTAAFRAQVLAAYQEGASMRGVCRVFGIARGTLDDWLKKSQVPAAADADTPIPRVRATCWNSMNSGRSSTVARTSAGSG